MSTAVLGEKILFASDLSKNSERILSAVIQMGPEICTEIAVIHVISADIAGGFQETLPELEKPLLDNQVMALREAGFNARGEFLYGLPYPAINEYIVKNGYKFLVVGGQGQSLLLREIFLGNQVSNIISHLVVPGLIIKTGKKENPPFDPGGKILFATDFSTNAGEAFKILKKIGAAFQPQVTLMHVQDTERLFPHLKHKIEEFDSIDKDRLDKMEKELIDGGVLEVQSVIRLGHTRRELVAEIERNQYNLVVMGSQGRGWFCPGHIGGVAKTLARKSPSSLLLVPCHDDNPC